MCARVSYEYVCVLASHMNMCAESLCVCACVSYKYACGEFVQARAPHMSMCASDFMCVVVHFICICLSTDFDELTP